MLHFLGSEQGIAGRERHRSQGITGVELSRTAGQVGVFITPGLAGAVWELYPVREVRVDLDVKSWFMEDGGDVEVDEVPH